MSYGLLFSCLGVGSVIAAFGLAGRREASERTLLAGGAAFTILLFLVALSPWFLVTAGLLALLGGAGIVFSTTANTRLQLAALAEMRGRVTLHGLMAVEKLEWHLSGRRVWAPLPPIMGVRC